MKSIQNVSVFCFQVCGYKHRPFSRAGLVTGSRISRTPPTAWRQQCTQLPTTTNAPCEIHDVCEGIVVWVQKISRYLFADFFKTQNMHWLICNAFAGSTFEWHNGDTFTMCLLLMRALVVKIRRENQLLQRTYSFVPSKQKTVYFLRVILHIIYTLSEEPKCPSLF